MIEQILDVARRIVREHQQLATDHAEVGLVEISGRNSYKASGALEVLNAIEKIVKESNPQRVTPITEKWCANVFRVFIPVHGIERIAKESGWTVDQINSLLERCPVK